MASVSMVTKDYTEISLTITASTICQEVGMKRTTSDHTWCGLLNVLKVCSVALTELAQEAFTAMKMD